MTSGAQEDPDIELRHVVSWAVPEIVGLYQAGGWWKEGYDPSGVPSLIRGSLDFVVAYHRTEHRAVGMGRLISDGASDAYIQDLVVLPMFRGTGVGRAIARELLRTAREKGLEWIGLIAEEGTEEFYEGLGFKRFKGTPMLYRGGD